MYKLIKRTCNTLLTLLLAGILALVGVLGIPQLIGYRVYVVFTASMHPAYPVGCVVFVKPAPAEEIREGDVITFSLAGFSMPVTHRVVTVNADDKQFITKGDNNKTVDFAPVHFENLQGIVVGSIPYAGLFIRFMQTGKGLLAAAGLLILCLLLLTLPEAFM